MRMISLTACLATAIIGGVVLWWTERCPVERNHQKSVSRHAEDGTVATLTPGAAAIAPDDTGKNPLPPQRIATGGERPAMTAHDGLAKADGGAGANAADAAAATRKERLFKHGTEQLLALATPAAPGMPVPPLPMIADESVAEDLKQAMRNTIAAAPGDTERTLEIKMTVAQQKEEFRELRQSGMTFSEYVNALRNKFNDDARFLAEAKEMDEYLFHDATVSDADYKAYREELNRYLRERGLPELETRNAPESHQELAK